MLEINTVLPRGEEEAGTELLGGLLPTYSPMQ